MPGRFYRGAGPYHGRVVSFTGYEPNRASIARCAVGPELHHAISAITEHARVFAELISPNDSSEYQASFTTEVHVVPDIPFRQRGEPMARWAGEVANISDHAILVEVGGQHTPDYRVMRRTLEWIELVAHD